VTAESVTGSSSTPAPAHTRRSHPRTSQQNTGQFSTGDWALFAGISLIWGASFVLIAFSLEGLTPSMVTLLRVGLGAATLWALRLGAVARGKTRDRIDREHVPRLILLSIVWVAIPFTLFPLAQEHINSALTGLLNGAMPIFAALISVLVHRHAPRGAQLAGLLIGFVGILLISLPSINDSASQARGVALVVAATFCYGIAVNLAPPLQERYGAVTLMSSVLGLATIWVAPLTLFDLGTNSWRFTAVAAVVILGVIGTGCAYWIMATLVGRVGPIRSSFITYLIPVVSLVLGIVIRNDSIAALAVVGAVCVIAGALLASRRESQNDSSR